MHEAIQSGIYRVITALDAVAATTTSEEIVVAGAKKVSFMFTRTNHSSGSSAFSVEVSLDGTTYVAYNKLISNVTNTNAQTLTRVASVSLASNTSTYATMDLEHDAIYSIKVTATETTDGNHTAKAIIEW
jgi:N-acetyl-beta-hexosaminidase